jgi:signal transduction histidine kinase
MQAEALDTARSARIARALAVFSQRYWRFVVVAMLVLLHVVAARGVTDPWARALMLAHLGTLLLWQPFLRGEVRLSPTQAVVIALVAAAVTLRLDWWLLAFWVVVLAGLVGGKVYQQDAPWQRRFYLLVFVYLLALLAVVILPEIAPRREVTEEVRDIAEYALPVLFVPMLFLPTEPEGADAPQAIDFFYSIFLVLVLGVVVLGSFTFMTLGRQPYLESLTYTVFGIAATILLIGLAWSPRTGFAGLNVFFARYLFSIGLPIEKWLFFLAELSRAEGNPERFVAQAVAGLARLPWVSGAAWRSADGEGRNGAESPNQVQFANEAITLTIWSRYRLSPALDWHLRLLGQLLAEFYVAKRREEAMRAQSYLQAVHETGARMTHDIKNLLQSLNVLCAAAARDEYRASPELEALMRRQLPVVAQRLGKALEKLERPREEDDDAIGAEAWWAALRRQYRDEGVEFEARGLRPGIELPGMLFDSVAANLLRNALRKRSVEGKGIQVRVALECDGTLALRVADTGRALPAEQAESLFRSPLPSEAGMGIGLFQAARQAEARGYALTLERNREGDVCFALKSAPR